MHFSTKSFEFNTYRMLLVKTLVYIIYIIRLLSKETLCFFTFFLCAQY